MGDGVNASSDTFVSENRYNPQHCMNGQSQFFLTNWIILNIVLFIFFFGGFFSDHIDPLHSLSGGTIRQIKTCFNIKNPFPERYPYFRSMAIK